MSDTPLQYFRHYSLAACKLECLTRFMVARCRCRAAYMPETTPGEQRSLERLHEFVEQLHKRLHYVSPRNNDSDIVVLIGATDSSS